MLIVRPGSVPFSILIIPQVKEFVKGFRKIFVVQVAQTFGEKISGIG
jgi:hypothetical protein